jgi:hypothetical protein
MFHFKHAPEEVHAIIQGLEAKVAQLQALIQKLVNEANSQAQQAQVVPDTTAPVTTTDTASLPSTSIASIASPSANTLVASAPSNP